MFGFAAFLCLAFYGFIVAWNLLCADNYVRCAISVALFVFHTHFLSPRTRQFLFFVVLAALRVTWKVKQGRLDV